MAVLVIADHTNSALNDATHKTVTAAKAFGGPTALHHWAEPPPP